MTETKDFFPIRTWYFFKWPFWLFKKKPKKRSGFFLKIGPIARQIDAACLGFTQKKNGNVAFFLIILLPSDCGDGWRPATYPSLSFICSFLYLSSRLGYIISYTITETYLMRHWHSFFKFFLKLRSGTYTQQMSIEYTEMKIALIPPRCEYGGHEEKI